MAKRRTKKVSAGSRGRTARAKPATKARKKTAPPAKSAARRPASRPTPARKLPDRGRAPAVATRAQGAIPNGIGLRNHHMDYTSHVLEDVKRFYIEVLGFRDFALDPKDGYLRIRTGATSSVGFMAPMPGPPEQWRPPREPAIYLEVDDVDRAHRELSARGVRFMQPPTDMPWSHRVAVLRDPEGRTIMLAQQVAPGRGAKGGT